MTGSETNRAPAVAAPQTPAPGSGPKVVYVQAPVLIGRLLRREGDRWCVALGGSERWLEVDPVVDPALLDEAAERGAPVLIEQSEAPLIIGVVATQRSLVIDQRDQVDAEVERFRLKARSEFLLQTPSAFVRAKAEELELFGGKLLMRGRALAKVLAAMIEFN